MEVIEQVRGFILEDLSWEGDPGLLTEQYPLIRNKVVDSLGIVQIVTMLEDEYGVEIEDDELVEENFGSLRAIEDLVKRKAAAD